MNVHMISLHNHISTHTHTQKTDKQNIYIGHINRVQVNRCDDDDGMFTKQRLNNYIMFASHTK